MAKLAGVTLKAVGPGFTVTTAEPFRVTVQDALPTRYALTFKAVVLVKAPDVKVKEVPAVRSPTAEGPVAVSPLNSWYTTPSSTPVIVTVAKLPRQMV